MDDKSRKKAGMWLAVGLGAFMAVGVFGGPYLLALDKERSKAPTGAVSVYGQQPEPIGLRMRGEKFVQGDTSGRSATQILNEQGGGIPCSREP